MDNVHSLGTSAAAQQRLSDRRWRDLVLVQFDEDERRQVGDEALVEAAQGAREMVEGIAALSMVLAQAAMPLQDAEFSAEQRQTVEATRSAHLEVWTGIVYQTAIREQVKEDFEG